MGNFGSQSKVEKPRNTWDFYNQLLEGHSGDLLHVSSYTKWIRQRRRVCGFWDRTDYDSARDSHRRHGVLAKPDNCDGRYFDVTWKGKSEITLAEKTSRWDCHIKVPRVPVHDVLDPVWLRRSRHNRHRKESSVIGYHDGLAVVQVNCDRHYSAGKFYVLDFNQKACLGHFIITYHTRRWYECYISPGCTRILLRPDHLTRVVVMPDDYSIHHLTFLPEYQAVEVRTIPPILRRHVLTFNALLGEGAVVLGALRGIEVRQLPDWSVVHQVPNLPLPADIQQLRSSPFGDFLAARCVQPVHSKEYWLNVVVVLSFPSLQVLMQLDVRGCYWPVSEVINLQVFPRFSSGEASLAVMKNCSYHRKVFVHKLPVVQSTLRSLCRRMIMQLISVKDVEKLPLPSKIIHFLQYPEFVPKMDASTIRGLFCEGGLQETSP